MIKRVELLRRKLAVEAIGLDTGSSFNVRCVTHVITAVKNCFKLLHSQIDKIQLLINSTRASVKRQDMFYIVLE